MLISSSRIFIKVILCAMFASYGLPISAQSTGVAGTSVASKIETLPDAPQMIATVGPSLRDSAFAFAITNDFQATGAGQRSSSPGLQDHKKPSNEPTLDDLGLPADQTKPDPDMQARLDRRTYMLKMHQRMGLLTLAPLAAACISSAAAPPDPRNGSGNTVGRDIHLSLGSLSVLSYGATAYYAIRAPKVSDGPARGGIKLHKYLIYIHGPGMILTPILGAMAFNQANNGEKVHGIASAHAAVAWTTVAAYSTAIVAVSWPIHLKF
jgi:hypothetical protein